MKPLIGITADIGSAKNREIPGCGSDGSIFRLKRSYVSAVVRAGGTPLVLVPLSDDLTRIAEIVDGLIVPGGGDLFPEYYNETVTVPSECLEFAEKDRTDFELELIQTVNKKQKPVLGICYGMQLINIIFGGTLYQDIRHQISGAHEHKNSQHTVKITGPFRHDLQQSSVTINSNHHQAVKTLGKGLEVFAEADDGIIEGIHLKTHPFMVGVQWHAEQGCDTLSLKIFDLFIEKATAHRMRN